MMNFNQYFRELKTTIHRFIDTVENLKFRGLPNNSEF